MSKKITPQEALDAIASIKNTESVNKKSSKSKLYRQLWTYLIVMTFLIILNLVTSPSNLWFIYPALGRGLGIAIHFIKAWNHE